MPGKVCIVSSVHRYNDTRVFYKQARSLARFYEVELHAIADFGYKKIDNVHVFGLQEYPRRVFRALHTLRLLRRVWRKDVAIVHFHDPELMILGLVLSFFSRKKLIYDIHEDYSKTIRKKYWIPPALRHGLAVLFARFERFAARRFHANIVVLDHWAAKYPKSFSVKNYPIAEEGDFSDKEKKLIYVGNLDSGRGILEMIEAFLLFSEKNTDFRFEIVGKWASQRQKEQAFEKAKNSNKIVFRGYIPIQEARGLIAKASLGFCLYTDARFEENIPVKMYEYLMFQTPVVCSDFDSWKKRVQGEGWGIAANPAKPEQVAQAIEIALENHANMLKACYEHRQKYTWEKQEKKLFEQYEKLFEQNDTKN